MIDIPLGKALVPVEADYPEQHEGCIFYDQHLDNFFLEKELACSRADGRKDGKNVIFKLIDYPEEKKQ